MNILKSAKKALALAVMGSAVLAQMSCEKQMSDVTPVAEYGNWRVLYYTAFDAGLVGASTDAATMCAYNGANQSFVYLDAGGTGTAEFASDKNPNAWFNKTDGKTIVFENSIPGQREEKGTTKLRRQLVPSMGVTYHNVVVTAGNEAAINIIPRTDFVSASWDSTVGKIRLDMNKPRDKRYIRIRTDYNTIQQDPNDGQWYIVVVTDLYQIDCGSSAREAGAFNKNEMSLSVMAKAVPQVKIAKVEDISNAIKADFKYANGNNGAIIWNETKIMSQPAPQAMASKLVAGEDIAAKPAAALYRKNEIWNDRTIKSFIQNAKFVK